METMQQKTERNFRVQARYAELDREGKHGHIETMFRVVREEVERERERCAKIAEAHKGAAGRKRHERGFKLHMAVAGYEEIVAEERGEDIAAEMIAKAIRALD